MKRKTSTLAALILSTSATNAETISYRFEGELNTNNQFLSEYQYATGVINFFNPGILEPTETNLSQVGGPPGTPFGQTSEPTTVYRESVFFQTPYSIEVQTSDLAYSNTSLADVSISNLILDECLLYFSNEIWCDQQNSNDNFQFSSSNFSFAIPETLDGSISELNLGSVDFVSFFNAGGASASFRIFNGDLSYNITNIEAVPLPATAWLFFSSLIVLAGFSKQKKHNSILQHCKPT